MLYCAIPPKWLEAKDPSVKSIQTESEEEVMWLNTLGYNVYFYPNYPSTPSEGFVKASEVDCFGFVFLDLDLKHGAYASKDEFVAKLQSEKITPNTIVDSGNGIHAYYRVSDLEAFGFLRLSRRLSRFFSTDTAVSQLKQLMRLPGSNNTKDEHNFKPCSVLYSDDRSYTSEQLDKWLPKITPEDEIYCKTHYDRSYGLNQEIKVDKKIPHKFIKLMKTSSEAKELFSGNVEDRSKADYRLAHILQANDFTKAEAMSVLVNCSKAIGRAETHRNSYASNIVDKIWIYEEADDKEAVPLSNSVKDILKRGTTITGKRLHCWPAFDNTHHGFRTGHVMGLIGGSGSGKTTLTLNYMYWFARLNPDSHHLFFSGEQPEEEIAEAWFALCSKDNNESILERMHILGNYDPDGNYRNLSLSEIENYVLELEGRLKVKIGCLGIDHIGILRQDAKNGEGQRVSTIAQGMKAVAKKTDTFLIMQSQTSREKAGEGDLELNIDAAYMSGVFEHFCDWLVTSWQPLKRIYPQAPHMLCNAYKYCKMRHKHARLDKIKEGTVQILMFDPDTKRLSVMTEQDDIAYDHFNGIATAMRNRDRKREPTRRTKIDWVDPDKGKKCTK